MMRKIIEKLLGAIVKRPVSLTFSHLGDGQDYTLAIQTSLYEFDDDAIGPSGPMYVAINSRHLHNEEEITNILGTIIDVYGE